jgi:choline-glycine betaine transporter
MQSFPEPSNPKRPSWYVMVNGITHAIPKVLLLSSPFMLILLFLSFMTIQELRQDLKKLNHEYHLLQKAKQQSYRNQNLKFHTPLRQTNSAVDPMN